MAASRLGRQIAEVIAAFDKANIRFALIGGLALASHHVVRATQDIDLLVDTAAGEQVDTVLTGLGYACLHRSADAANYLRDDEKVDLLYASRPIARELLNDAETKPSPFGALRVVGVEGLIGFKLQAVTNEPRRTQDVEDIRALLRANRSKLDIDKVRSYFELFHREALLDEILRSID
jgi:predicted nucleotidyltransferase